MSKLFSGRFIFTLISAFVFAALALKGTLPQDKVMEVILLVVYAYFNRGDRVQQNGGQTK
jgi:amino acid permease